jgi:hypothetical protein
VRNRIRDTNDLEGRLKQMGKRTIAMVATALLGLGVIGVGAARVGGYISNSVGPVAAASQTSSQTTSNGTATSQAGASSAGGLAAQTGDGAGQGGD